MLRWTVVLVALALCAACSTIDADDAEPRLTPLAQWGDLTDQACAPYWQASMESCQPAVECPEGMVAVCGFKLTMPIGCGGYDFGCGKTGQMAPVECCSAQVCADCRCDSPGEVCGNLLDDDMDGATDEDCPAVLQYVPDLPGLRPEGDPPAPLPIKVPHGVLMPLPKVPNGG